MIHKKVYIVAAQRTPLGSFGGALSKFSAPQLGTHAIAAAIEKAQVPSDSIDEVFMGQVCQANSGQAPARQAAIGAHIPNTVPATTVNKVCSSGMKSIMFAAQQIQLSQSHLVIAGGMESMSNIPYYLPNMRWGQKFGAGQVVDGLQYDGLTDAYNKEAMGGCADATAERYNISREAQDDFAINSYRRAAAAHESGAFAAEISAISVPQRKGEPLVISEDEEYTRVKLEKIPTLRPAFSKTGSVTAANASTINDGAAALVIASEEAVKQHNLNPIAEIISYADAAHAPEWFTTAPSKAAQKALELANLSKEQIEYWEVNEAFAVVTLAFAQLMDVSTDIININGGAVALGHPLGCSGARIVTTLIHTLHQKNASLGLATLCNGGGGASAMIVKKI